MHVIKKYANRKLYHVNNKRYITLEGIAALVQRGEPITIIDNQTDDDITAQILAQVALQSRGEHGWLPANLLTGLIRAGNETLGGIQRTLSSALSETAAIDVAIRHRLDRLHERGAIDAPERERMLALLTDHAAPDDGLPSRSDIDRLRAQVDGLAEAVESLVAAQRRPPGG